MLKVLFGFAECQEKATYCLGYRLTLTRNKDNAVVDKVAGTADARTKSDYIHCYVPFFIPSLEQENTLMKLNIKNMATELKYIERFLFMKEIKIQNL